MPQISLGRRLLLDCLALLGVDGREPIKEYVRSVIYVPEFRSIQDLLLDLRHDGQMLSVVVDEFGGAEGIVTIEDIIEEVVEDIQDEHDAKEVQHRRSCQLGENDYLVSARIGLAELAEQLGIELPEGGYQSLGGFLLSRAKEIPQPGAVIEYRGVRFSVERASRRLIQEVRVRW